MTKAELHHLVDRLPDQAVDGAAILLEEITDGRIDSEQAWFWTREWQQREREADKDLANGKVTRFESDEEFLAALDERTKPLDAGNDRRGASPLRAHRKDHGIRLDSGRSLLEEFAEEPSVLFAARGPADLTPLGSRAAEIGALGAD